MQTFLNSKVRFDFGLWDNGWGGEGGQESADNHRQGGGGLVACAKSYPLSLAIWITIQAHFYLK